MNPTSILKVLGVGAACLFAFSAFAAEDTIHWYLKHPAWVCASPEAYAGAIKAQGELRKDQSLDDLEKDLFAKQLCVYIDEDEIEGLSAPYLTVLGTQGELTHVSFIIKFEKRLALLNREMNWYKFNGWTEQANLKELW